MVFAGIMPRAVVHFAELFFEKNENTLCFLEPGTFTSVDFTHGS